MSLDLILPFLEPVRSHLENPAVSEVMVNGNGSIFVEEAGQMRHVGEWMAGQKQLRIALQQIARQVGRDIDEQTPQLNARLADGSRVSGMLPPVSVGGVQLSVRKFQRQYFSLGKLIDSGALPLEVADLLVSRLIDRQNFLVCGSTSAGKTTLANALVNEIPQWERLGIIEETAEIEIIAPNVFRFEARRGMPGFPEITQRDLLQFALRHRPDRLFVGEILGAEAFDLLQALNTGHNGSIATIHSNSAEDALHRLSDMVLEANISGLPYRSIQAKIGRLIQIVLQVVRVAGRRYVSEVVEVRKYDPDKDQFVLNPLYVLNPQARSMNA